MTKTQQSWTTRALLAWMGEAFAQKDLDAPRRLAEELLAHVFGCERLALYTDADRPATEIERSQLRDLVKRALAHEPVQYLVGHESFYGIKIRVDRRVLIPRPSTQTIVDAVLAHFRSDPRVSSVRDSAGGDGALIADVCTGSGCVAIALAKNLPGARLVATDVSTDALDLARENADHAGVDERIEFLAGDLLTALDAHPVAKNSACLAALCSNPPYIPDHEWAAVEPNVKDHEPTLALRGGADGLDMVRPLLTDGPGRVMPGGILAVEVAESHAAEALELARAHELLERAEILRDSDGLDRVIVARRKR
ncbi:MAG: release factor glutamine methyltransferase [Phycisphaeraceae bacterium]|nr:MAG: release factor glutamine methyltransferase [Phycisphaeraceae bacterium]